MKRPAYPTDLTDAQWLLISVLIPPAKTGGRKRTTDIREVLNAIFYLLRTGCGWRLLPHDFPAWGTVHYYYWKWRKDGTWQRAHDALRSEVREAAGKEETPSAAILDSQSVKATEKGGSAAPSATTRERRSRGASVTSSSTPSA